MNINYPNDFVVVEGPDKGGKSTLIEGLKERLDGNWLYTHEPSSGDYGQLLRQKLGEDEDPSVSDLFLFLADRYDHVENTIEPALQSDEYDGVITDRYHLSTLAYQSSIVEEQLNVKSGRSYINRVTRDFHITPDLMLVMYIPVDECLNRMEQSVEKYENRDRLEQAGRVYSQADKNYHYAEMLNGLREEEQLVDKSLRLIEEL